MNSPKIGLITFFCAISFHVFGQKANLDTITYKLFKSANDFYEGKFDAGHWNKKHFLFDNGKEDNGPYWGTWSNGMLTISAPQLKKKLASDEVFVVLVCGKLCLYFGGKISFSNHPSTILEITAYKNQPLYVSLGLNGTIVPFDDIDQITDDPGILTPVSSFKHKGAMSIGSNSFQKYFYERTQFVTGYNKEHPTNTVEFDILNKINKDCNFLTERYDPDHPFR